MSSDCVCVDTSTSDWNKDDTLTQEKANRIKQWILEAPIYSSEGKPPVTRNLNSNCLKLYNLSFSTDVKTKQRYFFASDYLDSEVYEMKRQQGCFTGIFGFSK